MEGGEGYSYMKVVYMCHPEFEKEFKEQPLTENGWGQVEGGRFRTGPHVKKRGGVAKNNSETFFFKGGSFRATQV